jgi:threonine/homoserine/homoserine lactone efflux protein
MHGYTIGLLQGMGKEIVYANHDVYRLGGSPEIVTELFRLFTKANTLKRVCQSPTLALNSNLVAYLTLFVIAFAASAGATIPPGLLNMNAARIRVANGSGPALRFIAGVATVIAVEAWAAAAFSKFVYQNPEVQRNFLWLGIGVFSLLTWYFFNRSQKSVQALKDQRNFFLRGAIMGALNVLNIPFYAVMHAVLRNASLVRLAPSETLVFASAAMSGTAVYFLVTVTAVQK